MTALQTSSANAHTLVLGNEKGGSGKSTLCIHLAVALMLDGMRVTTIDLDARKQTLTHMIRNRRKWAETQDIFLPTPENFLLDHTETDSQRTNKWSDFEAFSRLFNSLRAHNDFIIIDTPSAPSQLSSLAHAVADTLLTPINDSMLDIDVLAHVAPNFSAARGRSSYVEVVEAARQERLVEEGVEIDWVVLRNRLLATDTPNHKNVGDVLSRLSKQLSFREVTGIGEHLIYREYFNMGLTALDPVESFGLRTRHTVDHMASRNEILSLVDTLYLPRDERGRRRKQAQLVWRQSAALPLELTEVLA